MTLINIDELADKVAERLEAWRRPVLPLSLAVRYVGKRSDRGFYRWCEKWGVQPCDSGRYSRAVLDRAMNKESKQRSAA